MLLGMFMTCTLSVPSHVTTGPTEARALSMSAQGHVGLIVPVK